MILIAESTKVLEPGIVKMKSFKQFMSESVNISGDFNGNLYVNSQPEEPKQVGENYVADVTWMGSIYRLEMVSKNGIPTKQELGEQLQKDYPGAMVQNIYPAEEKNFNIKNARRYHPSKLEWID
jgi:hypothetical protein